MTRGRDNTDCEQTGCGRQTSCPAVRSVLAALLLLLLAACTAPIKQSSQSASIAHDAEAHLPPAAAIALSESDGVGFSLGDASIRPLWDRLRSGFAFRQISHPRIDHEIGRLTRSPQAFESLILRAEPYLHHILNEVELAGLPTELALLPAVESGFRPHAYSPDGAVGLWQFMPGTGRMMGLGQDWWFDERRTVRASTRAAIAFLGRLNDRFDGDWLHALAAYNAGSAKVGRSLRRARQRAEPTDFWSLDLPGETDRYVPRLLALARVIDDPAAYGLTLPSVPDAAYFRVANTSGPIDLNIAAQLAEVPVETVIALNAGHRRWATNPEGPHELLLPIDKADAFEAAVTELPTEKRLRWQRHKVREGDSLNRIADQYGVSSDAIRKVNRMRNSHLRAGRDLLIPLSEQVTPELAAASQLTRQRLRYQVRKGDSLYTIARRFQVSIGDLKRWNQVGRYIRPGERLTVFVEPDA